MMADFLQTVADAAPLSEEQQKKAGQAIGGDMSDAHKNFLKTITGLIDRNEIDFHRPETFLKKEVYDRLDAQSKSKADFALMNVATLLKHIEGFYRSKQTPDSSPQLATMIEQLWEMKSRLETELKSDIFKF